MSKGCLSAAVMLIIFTVVGAGICFAVARMGKAAELTTGQGQFIAACILLPVGYIFWKEWRDNYA